jgi:hypothetical protein
MVRMFVAPLQEVSQRTQDAGEVPDLPRAARESLRDAASGVLASLRSISTRRGLRQRSRDP